MGTYKIPVQTLVFTATVLELFNSGNGELVTV